MAALQDVFAEINAVTLWQQRRRDADNAAASFNPAQVREMSLASRMYPDIRPGALLALAYGKYPHDHPLVQQVGELSAALDLREHPGGVQIGDPGVGRNVRRANAEARREANRAVAMHESNLNTYGGQWAQGNPELKAAWEQAFTAGLVENGMLVAPEHGPQRFVFDEVTRQFARAGVELPFVSRDGSVQALRHNANPGPARTPEQVQELVDEFRLNARVSGEDEAAAEARARQRVVDETSDAQWETVTLMDGPPEPESDSGPGLLDQVRRATGSQPRTPAERHIAGIADASITTPVRSAFMGMDAPVQEIQGQIRNLYAVTQGKSPDWTQTQSDFGIQLTNPGLSSGSGFFVDPESELASERRSREAERGQIGGHNVTAGRWLANSIGLDPDTKPFQLMSGLTDLSVQLADPTAWGLGKAGELRGASRLFAAAGEEAEHASGLVRGLRNVFRPVEGSHWLDNAGRESVEAITHMRSPTEVARALNYKGGAETWVALADTRANTETRAVLEDVLGTRIRRVDDATVGAGRPSLDPRKNMPTRGAINTWDRDNVFMEMESFLHNAGASPQFAANYLDGVLRAENPIEMNRAIRNALDDGTDGLLVQAGVTDPALRSQLVRMHETTHEATRATVRAAMTNQGPSTVPVMVGGEAQDALDPVLLSELAPQYLPLPDARAIRRVTSRYSNILTQGSLFATASGKPRMATSTVEWLQNEMWKPLQLMRAAWTVRVVGEEQLRMAAAGYDSMFNHPLSFIALGTGRRARGKADSWLHPIALAGDVAGRKAQTDIFGTLIEESNAFTDSLAQTHGSWIDRAVVPTGVKTTYGKSLHERADYLPAAGSEILRLHGDPVARQIVDSESLDDVMEWFTRGKGNQFRGALATAYPGKFDDLPQARAYLENVQNRIHYATGGDGELTDAIRTGRLGGESLMSGTTLNRNVLPTLESKFDSLPDTVLGYENVAVPSSEGGRVMGWWRDQAVDRLFGVLMTNRTNNLSRSRTFKQEYWREAERLVGFADETTKATVLQGARDANLGSRAIRRIERVKPTGTLGAEELDLLAKGQALDTTKELLYDLSRKGRFMDAARLVFPFGEAWKEVLTRWLDPREGIFFTNPKSVRRLQQGIQGARGEDFGDFMGAPDGEGFFWKNEFGDEVFIYPGSGILTEKLLGAEIPMPGSVQGLSMFGTVIPGLGPAVQIPTAWILHTKPGPQWMREAFSAIETARVPEEIPLLGGTTARENLLPFGSPSEADMGEAANLLNYLPTWMRTAANWATGGDGNERQYANALNAIAAYKSTTGEYGTSIEERQRLMEDSARVTPWFFLIKAVAQSVAPSSPQEDWRVVDRNDRSLRVRALAEEYRQLQESDYESADRAFLDRYGADVLAAIQADTAGVEYSLPTTREGVAWVIANPDAQADLPHTYGFFAPKGGDFDYALYAEQFNEGQRHQLNLEQWTRLMNTVKGDLQYEDAKLEVGDDADTDDGEAYLRDVREWISGNYDGWGDATGIPRRPETGVLVRELYHALNNDAVMDTDAGQGLRLYLEGRDEVMADAESRGVGLGSQEMEDGRAYLADLGQWVIGEHPGFKDVFDIVLSRELRV